MPMHQMREVEAMTPGEIARGLTKAQREALFKMPMPYALETVMEGVVMLDSWTRASGIGVHGGTLMSMNGLGGIDQDTLQIGPILVTCDWSDDGFRVWKITPLGLSVRAELERIADE